MSASMTLSPAQRELFFEHLEAATNGAARIALKRGAIGNNAIATGVLDDLAMEAWAKQVAAGKVDPAKNPASYAYGAGQFAAMTYFRQLGRLECPPAVVCPTVKVAGRTSSKAADFTSEEQSLQMESLRRVLDTTGGEAPTTHREWQALALSIGVGRVATYTATKSGLPALVVARLKEMLNPDPKAAATHDRAPAAPDPVVSYQGQPHEGRISPERAPERRNGRPKGSRQEHAERFVVAWQTHTTAREVAQVLDQRLDSVKKYARFLRSIGVNLKRMPNPGAAIRHIRGLATCAN